MSEPKMFFFIEPSPSELRYTRPKFELSLMTQDGHLSGPYPASQSGLDEVCTEHHLSTCDLEWIPIGDVFRLATEAAK